MFKQHPDNICSNNVQTTSDVQTTSGQHSNNKIMTYLASGTSSTTESSEAALLMLPPTPMSLTSVSESAPLAVPVTVLLALLFCLFVWRGCSLCTESAVVMNIPYEGKGVTFGCWGWGLGQGSGSAVVGKLPLQGKRDLIVLKMDSGM